MDKYKTTFENIHIELEKAQHVLLLSHKSPDGDATGSSLALAHFLHVNDKEFTLFNINKPGSHFEFMPGHYAFKNDMSVWDKEEFDLLVVMDSSNLNHTSVDEEIKRQKHDFKIINIDHHISNDEYGHINLVVPDASSTSEIIYHLLDHKRAVTKEVATCLLTGIMTDTGGFQNMATTPGAIDVSSKLMNKGANIKQVAKFALDQKPVNTLKLWGRALQRLKINEKNKIISTVITTQDLEECNATEEAMEGVANFLNELDQARDGVVMVLSEREDGKVKGSLRTTNGLIDVSKLAKILGGGGHKKASGFTIDGKLKEGPDGWEIV
ncbi:bifunctional oligoribonuclease/PAP phosphatase NrnA [Patescibacteria group bacterium]|nr:bifunctional oligoribonuclease/PAP phosphatase NrnA [Patescibacteria group bacterium]MBU1673732.1 bifunctional oligoribonuclease/PAP phosphatase NrnA [Patescibacteria group bacterium]MBU1963099.1 bifunctional oligoribonuclease/PAP phosphatase NrnA [Patescibacteria group bacterium]